MGLGMGSCCCGGCTWVSLNAPITHNFVRIEHHLFWLHFPWISLTAGSPEICPEQLRNNANQAGPFLLIYSHDDELTDTHVFERIPASTTRFPSINCRMKISRTVAVDHRPPGLGGPQTTQVKLRAIESLEVYRDEDRFAWERDLDAEFPFREPVNSADVPGARLLQTAGCRCSAAVRKLGNDIPIHTVTFMSPRILDAAGGTAIRSLVDADGGCESFSSDHTFDPLIPFGHSDSDVDGWAVQWFWDGSELAGIDWFGDPYSRTTFLNVGTPLSSNDNQSDPILATTNVQLATVGGSGPLHVVFTQLLASAATTMTPLNSVWDNDWFVPGGQSGPGGPCDAIDVEVSQP